MSDELKTVSYDKTGRIRVQVDDVLHTLRVPKYGEFKAIKNAAVAAQATIDERVAEAGDDSAKQSEVVDLTLEELAEVKRLAFQTLSDQTLPEDSDEWPAWLVMSGALLTDFITHWRDVPLGRG